MHYKKPLLTLSVVIFMLLCPDCSRQAGQGDARTAAGESLTRFDSWADRLAATCPWRLYDRKHVDGFYIEWPDTVVTTPQQHMPFHELGTATVEYAGCHVSYSAGNFFARVREWYDDIDNDNCWVLWASQCPNYETVRRLGCKYQTLDEYIDSQRHALRHMTAAIGRYIGKERCDTLAIACHPGSDPSNPIAWHPQLTAWMKLSDLGTMQQVGIRYYDERHGDYPLTSEEVYHICKLIRATRLESPWSTLKNYPSTVILQVDLGTPHPDHDLLVFYGWPMELT